MLQNTRIYYDNRRFRKYSVDQISLSKIFHVKFLQISIDVYLEVFKHSYNNIIGRIMLFFFLIFINSKAYHNFIHVK